jgi:hypothetical protein
MFDNAGLRRLLVDHGENLTLRIHTIGTFNTSTLTQARTTTDYTVRGYFYDFSPSMIDGTSVMQGDRRVVLDSKTSAPITTPEPKPNDKIVGNGDVVNIVHVKKIISNGQLMCYILHVRE